MKDKFAYYISGGKLEMYMNSKSEYYLIFSIFGNIY